MAYDKFSKGTFKTLQKLQRFRMATHYDQFRIELLKHTPHNLEETFVKNKISKSINTTLEQKFEHVQVTKTFANRLWQIHLARQAILHKTYVQMHIQKFVKLLRHNKHFKINEIYQHHLRSNKVHSRSRFKIVKLPIPDPNPILSITPILHPFLRKIISLLNHAINTSVKLISNFRNYFSTSQYSMNNPLLTQISLRQLNAKT